MASDSSKFSLGKLVQLLSKCQTDDGDISIDVYLEAFTELNKMFHLLGTIFGFVASDVTSKIGILRQHRSSENADQYETTKKMINYEVTNDITVIKNRKKTPSGARTLLRLHRALDFIIHFLKDIRTAETNSKLGGIAWAAYKDTLSPHHTWIIRKTVGVAVYTLPTRTQLLGKMGEESTERAVELIGEAMTIAQPVYDSIQELYTANDLHSLP